MTMETTYQPTTFNGLDAIEIKNGASTLIVTLFGAHVVSWTIDGEEQLFLSSIAKFDRSKAIRGGIPVVFPQFGTGMIEGMAQHGFARNSEWIFEDDKFVLKHNEDTMRQWSHEFLAMLTVKPQDREVVIRFTVLNTGTEIFTFQSLLHTYFRVPHIASTDITGFKGLKYKDHLGDKKVRDNEGEVNTITEEVDREYQNYPPGREIIISCDGKKRFGIKSKAKIDSYDNPVKFDVVLWNAWIDKSAATADLDDDAFLKYVCVEPGTIAGQTKLEPGSSFDLEKIIAVPST